MNSDLDLWGFKDTSGHLAGVDLRGWKVEAADGSIGKVDTHSDEVGSAHLVVDTGPWIFGKRVLLPAGTVTRLDPDDNRIHVALTREQVKDSPEFEPATHLDDPTYRDIIGRYYGGPLP
ncbi:PRC-barrel domain containing protein [Streptomyces sp. NPDC048361]|uniref:PRC-barrel domain containing protein n=1 Tax=Streptomyces sp. NPDC048361 TaxID=3154720 RepID=UPI00344183F7